MTKNADASSAGPPSRTWKARRGRCETGTTYGPGDKDGKDIAVPITAIVEILLPAADTLTFDIVTTITLTIVV